MPSTGVSLTTTFANESGSQPASQLDTNFTDLLTPLNALATYANYYVDAGSANAIAITVPSPLAVSYAAGLPLQIKVAANNTGATTINVNGMGLKNLVYPSGVAMASGQLVAGGIISVVYDGTNFQYLGATLAASAPQTGSFTATLAGFNDGNQTGTVYYRIDAGGQLCCLYSTAAILGNYTTGGSFTLTGYPSQCQPAQSTVMSCLVRNGGISYFLGDAIISGGTITFNLSQGNGASSPVNFSNAFATGAVTYGVGIPAGWTITYPLT